METNRIALTPFLLSCLAVAAAESAAAGLLAARPGLPFMVVLGGLRLMEIFLLLGIITRWGGGIDAIGLARQQLVPGFFRGIYWSLVFGAVAAAGFALLIIVGINPFDLLRVRLPKTPLETVFFCMVGSLLGPVAEEIFFRGILYGYLRKWGIWPALIASNLVFVMAHATAAGSLPVPQIVGGVVFTLAYEKNGELTAPIMIHALGNTVLFGLSLV